MNDTALRRRIEQFLKQKGVVSLPRLTIELEAGQVLLKGTVRSFYERQLCLSCQHLPGVTGVVDRLTVDSPPAVTLQSVDGLAEFSA